ncbi:hypothetical protein ACFQS7_26980 [Dankookia sp. GCM10030260]|uniref:hypothetical protein n=1 Tax=Dankookia sp. GCM10030260 TaxID=3273390 RepID=UPI003607B443
MRPSEIDVDLVARLTPRLRALHEANGGDWTGTLRDGLALLRQTHSVEPRDVSMADQHGAETLDTPREDD